MLVIEKGSEFSYLLVYFPNGHNGWYWARLKLGVWDSIYLIWVSNMGIRTQTLGPSSTDFPNALSRELYWKWGRQDLNQCSYGKLMSHNLLCTIQALELAFLMTVSGINSFRSTNQGLASLQHLEKLKLWFTSWIVYKYATEELSIEFKTFITLCCIITRWKATHGKKAQDRWESGGA